MEFKHMTYRLPHMSISFVWQPNDQVIPCHTKSFPTWFCLRVNLHGTRASGLHSFNQPGGIERNLYFVNPRPLYHTLLVCHLPWVWVSTLLNHYLVNIILTLSYSVIVFLPATKTPKLECKAHT